MIARLLRNIIIYAIRMYQCCLSPFMIPCCRFYPTCSEYAITAFNRHGPLKGLFYAIKRILRCHPFHRGGYDPVR